LAWKIINKKLKKYYKQLLLNNDGYSPPPKPGYENSTFAINSTPIIPKLVHELKPYSSKKPKLKYEKIHDAGNKMRMFTGIRNPIEIHH
jgi:hypothetical protein